MFANEMQDYIYRDKGRHKKIQILRLHPPPSPEEKGERKVIYEDVR